MSTEKREVMVMGKDGKWVKVTRPVRPASDDEEDKFRQYLDAQRDDNSTAFDIDRIASALERIADALEATP